MIFFPFMFVVLIECSIGFMPAAKDGNIPVVSRSASPKQSDESPPFDEGSSSNSYKKDIFSNRIGRNVSFIPTPLDSTDFYEDQRPRRIPTSVEHLRGEWRNNKHESWSDDWGVQQQDQQGYNAENQQKSQPTFPSSSSDVADAAMDAIAASLYGKEETDPVQLDNMMIGDSMHGRRPVRKSWDAGRIGVEIDEARLLFPATGRPATNSGAILRVALDLAAKLSQYPWVGYEESTKTSAKSQSRRPVVVYFNSVRQALVASHQLRLLKMEELANEKATASANHRTLKKSSYENVTILCLDRDSDIPSNLVKKRSRDSSKARQKGRPPDSSNRSSPLKYGTVDPSRGVVLVVQPTDYNNEQSPPEPVVNAIGALQQLVARASIEELPVVLVSPRFLAADDNGLPEGKWDQSGYQQSSSYGGFEPPKGPTPWIMRDFSPPVFSWIGLSSLGSHEKFTEYRDEHGDLCLYSGLSLTQSVMHQKRAWHVFLATECIQSSGIPNGKAGPAGKTRYEYLASTKSASGRPTRELLHRVFRKFASFSTSDASD